MRVKERVRVRARVKVRASAKVHYQILLVSLALARAAGQAAVTCQIQTR